MQLEEFQARKKAQRAPTHPQQKPQVAVAAPVHPASPPVQTQASPAGSSTSKTISPAAKPAQITAPVTPKWPAAEANGASSVLSPPAKQSPIASHAQAPALGSPAGQSIFGERSIIQNGQASDQQRNQQDTAAPAAPAISGQQASSESFPSQADDVPKLKKLVQQLKLRIQKQDKECASLREQLESSTATQADGEASAALLSTAQQQIASLQSQLSAEQGDSKGIRAQLNASDSKEHEARSSLAAPQKQSERLEADLQQQLQEAREGLKASKLSADAKQAEAEGLQAEAQRLQSSIEEAQAATADVQTRLDEAQASHSQTVADLQQRLSNLQGQHEGISSSAEELAGLRQEFTSLEEQVQCPYAIHLQPHGIMMRAWSLCTGCLALKHRDPKCLPSSQEAAVSRSCHVS